MGKNENASKLLSEIIRTSTQVSCFLFLLPVTLQKAPPCGKHSSVFQQPIPVIKFPSSIYAYHKASQQLPSVLTAILHHNPSNKFKFLISHELTTSRHCQDDI